MCRFVFSVYVHVFVLMICICICIYIFLFFVCFRSEVYYGTPRALFFLDDPIESKILLSKIHSRPIIQTFL